MFGVLILTAFLTKTVFSRGMGVHIILAEIPEGWGGLFLCSKYGNSREGGGGLCEIPSMVGVWIFSGTTHLIIFDSFPFMFSYIINFDCIALYCIVLIQKLLLQFLVV